MEDLFYVERDKRTDSLSQNNGHHKLIVDVIVTNNIKEYETQIAAIVLINILSRWCRNINVTCEDEEILLPNQANNTIVQYIEKMLLKNNPHGKFLINRTGEINPNITVFIGKPSIDCKTPYVAIDLGGWECSCSYNSWGACNKSENSKNLLGASFAACLANAELFRFSQGIKSETYTKWYSLLTMDVSDTLISNNESFNDLDLGKLHVVGCGAIGSSFTYLLGLTNLQGNITFVDLDEKVEVHNTSSSLLFNIDDTSGKNCKVNICTSYLTESKFDVTPFNGDYKEFKYDILDANKSADVILCFANDKNIWHTIQNLYPPTVFHATTSRSGGINIGRHIPLKDNCIVCTFYQITNDTYVPKCAEAEIKVINQETKKEEVHPSILPFASPAAAILSLAELIKFKLVNKDDRVPENVLEFNITTNRGVFLYDIKHKDSSCPICNDQLESLYNQLYPNKSW